ncbi:MAG: glycosyltransferase family 9 protein [Pseudolabrys sp.]
MPGAAPQRILVITLQRLGDVLLTTPLLRSLRKAWPQAQLDMLVFAGSEGILAGNPDISNVLTISAKAGAAETLRLAARIFRRYDLAISTQAGDKPTMFAWLAGRRRIGILTEKAVFKRWLLNRHVGRDLSVHRVVQSLRLLDGLDLEKPDVPLVPELVPPQGRSATDFIPQRRYAVLHPNPKFTYKRWNAQGWRDLAAGLSKRGLDVIVTGAPEPDERAYLDSLWRDTSLAPRRLDGRLNWPQLAALIRGAAVYIGTDTSMTHLAAATGAPTVAIYGPVDPRIMGPWPVGGLNPPGSAPWEAAGTIQRRGNVWVVQNPASCPWSCLPCEKLGCDGHLDSRAQCLDELSAGQVLAAVDAALTAPASVS